MKKKYIIFLFILWGCISISLNGHAQTGHKLAFNKDGRFKIAQFTDLHWSHNSPNCKQTTETIRKVLEAEKPQLAVLTGDVVTDRPAREAWQAIIGIFEEANTPFAVTLGNHDAEAGISKEGIFELLMASPWFAGEKGPHHIYGCGNYVLPVKGSVSGTSALLYFLDSNDYPSAMKYGHYDWIHYDQIEWYRKSSQHFTGLNNNIPFPALAFFHIPLLEFNNIAERNTTVGTREEGVASPQINSGFFASIIEMGDIMGAFVGHDHDNDYIGMEYDIALGFGRVSGTDAYGKLERGARIIEMYEGKFKFDTWIRTPHTSELTYYYPSGLSSVDEETEDYLPAQKVKAPKQGVRYTYYEGKFKSTEEMLKGNKVARGTMKEISIKEAPLDDDFGYEFTAWINIPETGIYRFYTYSDDGSKLLIDDKVVVNNDGSHSATRKDGKIGLEKGFHKLQVLYFEDYMGQVLEAGFCGKDIPEKPIPGHMLFLPE